MAIVKFINSKASLKKSLDYITKECKTNDNLITAINCNKESAYDEMMFTKREFNKLNGRDKVHIVQAFSPEENITKQEAHKIGIKFAEYFKNYEIVIATHIDKEHIHNHLILNSVNFVDGKKMHTNKHDLEKIKEYSNKLCNESNLKTIPIHKKYRDIKNNEYQIMLKGKSWKGRLISAIDFSLSNTNSKEEFILYMNQFGYDVNWQNTRKYITYTTPEGMKCRDNKLHEEKYFKEKMEDFYGIKRNESITNSSANEYENGRTSQKANIFRGTNTEIRKNRKINGFNNGKYKKIYKGIKCKNVQNRNNGNRYNKFNKRNTEIAKDVKNTSKIKIYGYRNDNKCNNINYSNNYPKIKYTGNSLNKALLNLFISNSNEITSKNDKIHSDFNSSAKLHYVMEKHYSLEELDDEMEI